LHAAFLLAPAWITEQESIEGGKDAAAIGVGPFDRVGALEFAIFRVGPVDSEAHN
jgi:hypothetical protein